jgi:hypothetical protein
MRHKIEIEIKDEKLWKVLCRMSSVFSIPVSDVLTQLTEHTFPYIVQMQVKTNFDKYPAKMDFPEIDDFLKEDYTL